MNTNGLNVKDFGAKGDGKSDDTKAIQKALDEASQAVLTCQDTYDVPYADGIPLRCGWGYHFTGPEVFFPYGHYLVSKTLMLKKTLALRGEGHPWIEQKDDDLDIMYSDLSIRQSFVGLAFHAGKSQLNLKELFNKGGKQTFDIKLYYRGSEFLPGNKENKATGARHKRKLAKLGDYFVIPFVRAER